MAAQQFVGMEVPIVALRVAMGDDVTDYPLGAQAEEEPAEEPVEEDVEMTMTEGDELVAHAGEELADDDELGSRRRREETYATEDDGAWEGVLVVEGMPSGDGRFIEENALTWRDLPLPLMLMNRNPEGGEGHAGAQLAGRIEWLERRDSEIWGGGHLDLGSAAGVEMHRLMADGMLRGVSADLDSVDIAFDPSNPEAMLEPGFMLTVAEGRLMGATGTPFPAFQEAQIHLVGSSESLTDGAEEIEALAASAGASAWVWTPWDPALVASAGQLHAVPPMDPPAAWFEAPTTDELMAMRSGPVPRQVHIGQDGRIYGFACSFKSNHIAFPGRKRKAPKSKHQYAYFQTGSVSCAGGEVVGTGTLVTDTVHPRLALQASDAQAFYADTGCAAADVAMHEVSFAGQDVLVFAGAQRPTITPMQRRVILASDGVSPDWRPIGGGLEMVGLVAVNNSGLKVPAIPDALVASAGPAPGELRQLMEGGQVVAMVGAERLELTTEELSAQLAQLARKVEAMDAQLRAERAAKVLGGLAASPSMQQYAQQRIERRQRVLERFDMTG